MSSIDTVGSARPDQAEHSEGAGRRAFLRAAGLGGLALGVAACATDGLLTESSSTRGDRQAGGEQAGPGLRLDFATDVGVLNYAYALEQLEAAFYVKVLQSPYPGMSSQELRLLTDVRDHEVAHREFFKTALAGQAIPGLTVNFSSINFGSRASVLGAAQTFEDTGVGAYNGAAKFLTNTTYLVIAGEIVSVEARHAAAIRDLLDPRSGNFAPAAFDPAFSPKYVLGAVDPFIVETLSVINA